MAPKLAVLEVGQRSDHGLHPGQISAQIGCVRKVIMSESLLELFCHLLKVCKVACMLHCISVRWRRRILVCGDSHCTQQLQEHIKMGGY